MLLLVYIYSKELICSLSLKVSQWMLEVNELSSIAKTHPQAAYAAYTHDLAGKSYLMRTIQDTSDLFIPLEDAI